MHRNSQPLPFYAVLFELPHRDVELILTLDEYRFSRILSMLISRLGYTCFIADDFCHALFRFINYLTGHAGAKRLAVIFAP